jgi:MipA family protein
MLKLKLLTICLTSLIYSLSSTAGELMVGGGAIAINNPYKGTDTDVLALPYFAYYGEQLELDITHIKYHWDVRENLEVALAARLRFDGYSASDSEYLTGLEDRDMAIEAGVSITYKTEVGDLKLAFFNDISDAHKGNESLLSYQKSYYLEGAMLSFETGVAFKSRDLVNYYYGVNASEVRALRPEYLPGAATSAFFSISIVYPLTDKWQLFSGLSYETLDKKIKDSPIVAEGYTANLLLGISYSL